MTLIERLLAQASKESNELADLLEEAAEALAQPQQEPVNQRAHETALRQWESWKAYALELQDKLVKYEGGTPMVLNTSPQPAQREPVTDEEPIGTYESVTDIMLHLRNGTISDQQIYEVMKDKALYTQAQTAQDQKPAAVVLQRNVKVGSTGGFRMKRYISPLNNGKLEMSPDLNVGDYLYKSTAKVIKDTP